jgi:hypothetical protein
MKATLCPESIRAVLDGHGDEEVAVAAIAAAYAAGLADAFGLGPSDRRLT